MQTRILHSRLAQRAAVALGTAALPALSFAQGLPQLENPTRGTGNGIMETIRNYGYDIIMLVALLVVASMFIGVCYHAYGTYAEIHTGRKTRSEEHTSELQSLMRISYAAFCLQKKTKRYHTIVKYTP